MTPQQAIERRRTGEESEDAVEVLLQADGWETENVNRTGRAGYRSIDLIARKNGIRMLVEVRGTKSTDGRLITSPGKCHKVNALVAKDGSPGIFAFAHITAQGTAIRFGAARTVTRLAEEWEADYLLAHDKPPRYHTNIDEWDIAIDRIAELLEPAS
jgi:Holliday junction resolvase-like predicted endonuclease